MTPTEVQELFILLKKLPSELLEVYIMLLAEELAYRSNMIGTSIINTNDSSKIKEFINLVKQADKHEILVVINLISNILIIKEVSNAKQREINTGSDN